MGGLVMLFSKTNQGKSEATMQFVVKWIASGHKVFSIFAEHSSEKSQQLLYKKITKFDKEKWKTVELKENGKSTGVTEMFIGYNDLEYAKKFYKNRFYLYDTNNGFSINNIFDGMNEALEKGCSVFVVDNQMMIDTQTSNELLEQKDNTERLRQWAKHNNVLVFLVAHARKVEPQRIRLNEYDILGSSNIANKATTIMTITRTDTLDINTKEYKDYSNLLKHNGINIEEIDSVIEVVKEKNGVGLGFVPLNWVRESKVYKEHILFGMPEEEPPVLHIKYNSQIEVEDIF